MFLVLKIRIKVWIKHNFEKGNMFVWEFYMMIEDSNLEQLYLMLTA